MPPAGKYLDGWRMAGANPERTSWVPSNPENQTDVPGKLQLEWYKPFEPFIWQKVQVIAADGLLFVSTARGLYALDATTGDERWVYPTEMPLGHSPTVIDGVAYVGCFDRRMHAMDAKTGQGIWLSDPAGAGFNTNPVFADGRLYAGNRDGVFYCMDAKTGKTLWRFETELRQPILFSAAYRDGTLYFAANDMHAYAVEAKTGKLVWKSAKLPGAGFHSYWPTIYRDRVIFTGCHGYRGGGEPSTVGGLLLLDDKDIYGSNDKGKGYAGALITDSIAFPWPSAPQTPTLDLSKKSPEGNGPVTKYFEAKPWRRTFFVLRRDTGKEVTYDFDGDGKPEYAPMLWHGTHSGNRFPPIVGGDGLLYQMAGGVKGQSWISRGGILAWKLDTPFVGTLVESAHDEPHALAAGGNQVYYYHAEGRDGCQGSADVVSRRHACYYWYIDAIAPDIPAWMRDRPNDMYGHCGDQNPPVPYKGKVYLQRWGHVLCFSPKGGKQRLAVAKTVAPARVPAPRAPEKAILKKRLADEVEKMLAAGHLRPGWFNRGLRDGHMAGETDNFGDWFHQPGETICVLVRAIPHLAPELQARTKDYLRREFETYPPDKYAHVGWQGVAREAADVPPEMVEAMTRLGPQAQSRGGKYWTFPPQANYALYQYTRVFGNAKELLSRLRRWQKVPTEDEFAAAPYAHNAYLAGLAGIVGLAELAGQPDAAAKAELDRLLALRVARFSKDRPAFKKKYDGVFEVGGGTAVPLTVSRNFMFLVPEVAQYLHANALAKVKDACRYYDDEVLPYWFVSKAEQGDGENTFSVLFDYHALFQATAMILKEPYEDLAKYLDVPAFWRGDLYYIDNLCACLEAHDATKLRIER
ncbi:MAG: PQQ-binding-like beta-propeller repeat protein [Thermoguttaceae bacterium]|jgi:outer membrane protein assembly factor BamB